jgi:hypothetical protein
MQPQCVLSCLESIQEEHGPRIGGNEHPRLDDPSSCRSAQLRRRAATTEPGMAKTYLDRVIYRLAPVRWQ